MTEPLVLIVEDELIIARDLSQKLRRSGYQVSEVVSSGTAVLAAIGRQVPDIVLMDIVIKGERDGIDVAQEIYERLQIPVVYLTAYADEDTLKRAERSGAYGYLLKPCNEREMRAVLQLALQKHQQYQELQRQNLRDPLTGLYNRRFLDEILTKEGEKAKRGQYPLSVAMIDLDHFKKFNDTHGHDAGDFVLKTVATLLLSLVRKSDYVCRYGGEELTVLFPNCPLEQARILAKNIRQEISLLSLNYEGQSLGPITCSCGLAAFPQHGNDIEAVLKAADGALLLAKRSGRNRVVSAGDAP
jgi:diguanylate cyclase (GGDEF)-like protein